MAPLTTSFIMTSTSASDRQGGCDNAPAYASKATSEFMAQKGIKTLFHASYSPDLAPCDFWLFPQLKKRLMGRRFDSDEEVKRAVEGILKELSENGLDFVFKQWELRLKKCVEMEGDFVEK